MTESYDPVFLPNESIQAKKHKVGEIIKMRVTEVMDDGVKVMCDHGSRNMKPKSNGMKEMGDMVVSRYKQAMAGDQTAPDSMGAVGGGY